MMCKWGTDRNVNLCVPTPIKVDACIAPLVQMLNDYGVQTIASCCGHGKTEESRILLSAKSLKLLPLDDGSFRAHLVFPFKEGVMTDHEHKWYTLSNNGSGLLSNHFFQCKKCPERLMFPDALVMLNEHAKLKGMLEFEKQLARAHSDNIIMLKRAIDIMLPLTPFADTKDALADTQESK